MGESRAWRKPFPGRWPRPHLFAGWLVLAVLVLANCGRGGDAAAVSAETLKVSGQLWHDAFGRDSLHGLKVSDLSGAKTVPVSAVETAVPTPDGRHFITYEYDWRKDYSTVAIYTRAGRRVDAATFNGYIRRVRPSPVQLGRMLVTWSASAGGVDSNQVVLSAIDFNGRVKLATYPGVDAAADWLPDGRVLHLAADGRLRIGTPALSQAAVAQIQVRGRKPAGLWVEPGGNRIITRWNQLWDDGSVKATDLWISSIDGRGLERLTDTGMTAYAVWSPDGEFFAFDTDPAHGCTSIGCAGSPTGGCDLHVAPASARGVGMGAPSFTVTAGDGRREVLGCDLRGWTR